MSVVEVVLLAPVFLLVLGMVLGWGRIEEAGVEVGGAARDAARAASLSRTPDAAAVAAQQSAAASLAAQSVECSGGPATTVDTSGFVPGGIVRVTVTCTVELADLGVPGFGRSTTMTGEGASPVEFYRGDL